jgi:ParB-like chromosome segregation protein Spo0J
LRRHPLKKLPTVLKLRSGLYLLWDGNHRATAAKLLGCRRIKCSELSLK